MPRSENYVYQTVKDNVVYDIYDRLLVSYMPEFDGVDVGQALTNSYSYLVSSGTVTYQLSLKQNVIADLETIRSGAGLGATAVQPTRKVAGLALSSDITAVALLGNLFEISSATSSETWDEN